jgi:hypothetical protein
MVSVNDAAAQLLARLSECPTLDPGINLACCFRRMDRAGGARIARFGGQKS